MVNAALRRTDFTVFALNLKRIRADLGWRQADLAQALGCRQSEVARWESLQIEPKASTVARIAAALAIPTDDLLTVEKLEVI